MNDRELNPEVCRDYGEKFWSLGLWEDALEFFLKGNYAPGLEKVRAYAVETGDTYLMARLGSHPPEVWRQVAEKALTLGKIQFARRALELAGDREKAEQLVHRFIKTDNA